MKEKILEICKEQVKSTPIVIIMQDNYKGIKNMLIKNGIVVENLAEARIEQIESAMALFTEKQNSQYQVYIVNEKQGRGFDFTSNSEIENNGGVYVIITFIPSYHLQFNQFVGRTARVGNKGQYSIVIKDKNSQNCEGKQYLNKKLLELQNKDILFLASLNQSQNNQINLNFQQGFDIIDDKNTGNNLNFKNEKVSQQIFQEEQKCKTQQSDINSNIISQSDEFFKNNEDFQITFQQEQSLKNLNQNVIKKRVQKCDNKEYFRFSKRIQSINDKNSIIDEEYFQSYADINVHQAMLNDQVRMGTYEEALQKTVKGKTVIDVGAGTGVLSLIAAKSGAIKVYAIEKSDIVHTAQNAIKDNGFSNIVDIYKEKAEEVILPVQKVDIIVSEWMGYSLIYENMLSSILSIRDKYLQEGGTIIPNRAQLYICGIQKESNKNGLNLSSINKSMIKKARIETVIKRIGSYRQYSNSRY